MKKLLFKSILFLCFVMLSGSISFAQTQTDTLADNSQIYTGKIIKVNFVDKGGREHKDSFNFFLETEDKQYFIKIAEGDVSRKDIAKYFNKEIKLRAVLILYGLWDTKDPKVESRVGEYLIIKEIL